MRKADNYITGNRRYRRLKVSAAVEIFLFLLDILILWSFYSYSVGAGAGKPLVLRAALWITNLSAPLVTGLAAVKYILKYIWIFLPLNALLLALMLIQSRKHGNYKEIEAGSAHWAYADEKKLFRKRENNQPLAEGVYMTKKAALPNGNVIVVANPGDGKSFRVLTPGIIQACRSTSGQKPSMIITDTKGALYRDTCRMVENAGIKVRTLNLTDPRYSNLYNPLCSIHRERLHTELSGLARCFIVNTRDAEAKTGDAFWEDTLYFLLMAVWGYQVTYEQNPVSGVAETKAMYRSLELIRGMRLESGGGVSPECEFALIVEHIRESKPLHISVTSFDSLMAAAPETIQSVVITAISRLAVFAEPDVEMLTMDDEMQIDALCEEPTALYLNFEVGSAYKVIAAMFLEQCFASIYYIADTKHGGSLPVKCKMYLDEIANICKFHSLPERLSTARSYNIDITLCLQALQQLKHLYDGSDQTIINNCAVFAYLGCGEPDTLERVSKLLGKTTIDEVNASRNYGERGGGSESDRRTGRELMTQDELFTLPRDKCILIIRGHNPIYADKCKTEKWREYAQLGGVGNPANNTDVTLKYTAEYSLHKERYDRELEAREERLRRLAAARRERS